MERRAPLRRTTRLASGGGLKRTPLKRAAELARSESKRRSPRPPSLTPEEQARRAQWQSSIADRCATPGCGRADVQLHHVVYAQHVQREEGDRFDPANGRTLCRGCHAAHHDRTRPVVRAQLTAANVAFARALLGDGPAAAYLERRYAGPPHPAESA